MTIMLYRHYIRVLCISNLRLYISATPRLLMFFPPQLSAKISASLSPEIKSKLRIIFIIHDIFPATFFLTAQISIQGDYTHGHNMVGEKMAKKYLIHHLLHFRSSR